jgi:TRAP-type C4-dicarboxylate transport system substrate-binding protein
MILKKIFPVTVSLVLTFVVIISLFLSSCSSTPSSPTTTVPYSTATPASTTSAVPIPTNSTSPATASSSAAATYEFKFLDQYAPGTAAAIQSELLGKLIMDNSGGKIKITYYHAEALGKAPDFLSLLEGGVTDIVNLTPGAYPTQFDVESYINLPAIGINTREACSEVIWALYNKGYLTGLTNFKPLAFNSVPPVMIFTKKKAITVDDLKGMKIRTADAIARQFLDKTGAVGTSMTASEVYMALDRGTIDGTLTSEEYFFNTKLYEVAKYCVNRPIISIGCAYILMNNSTWNKLPKDVQDGVSKAIEANKTAFLDSVKEADASYTDKLKQQGVDLYSFSSEETAKLFSVAVPIKNDWITQHQAKGASANEIAALVDSILTKYK